MNLLKKGDEVNWDKLKSLGFSIKDQRKVSFTWRHYTTRQEITARCRNGCWSTYKVTSAKTF